MFYFCPRFVEYFASAMRADKSLVQSIAKNFFLALEAFVCCHVINDKFDFIKLYFRKKTSDANFLPHLLHSHIPFDNLLTPFFLQKMHACFNLCFFSTITKFALTFAPYLAPNLPADMDFFCFDGIVFLFFVF